MAKRVRRAALPFLPSRCCEFPGQRCSLRHVNDTAAAELTAAQLRTLGDASPDQRAQLRRLLQTKRYPKHWRDRFFEDVRDQRGLSATRAAAVIAWLDRQLDLEGVSNHATTDQVDDLVELLRVRIAPSPIARLLKQQIQDKSLSFDQADLALRDLKRLPLREFPLPGKPGQVRVSDVPDGQYAVVGIDARSRYYKVTTDVVGGREVKNLNGPYRGRLIRNASQLERVLREIAADPAAAAKRYGAEAKKCAAPQCNRPIWDKSKPGFEHGFGPECWARMVAERKVREHKATIPDPP